MPFAYYGGSGLGGSQNPANICQVPDQQFCASANPNAALSQFPLTPGTSYSSTLNQLVNSTAPDKGVGLQLNIPLRNRAAKQCNSVANWNTVRRRWHCNRPKIR